MSSAHAREVPPSSLATRLDCTGSLAMVINLPENRGDSSVYSAEGTAAHTVVSDCLTENRNAADFIGRELTADGHTFEVDEDFAEHCQVYLDLVRETIAAYELTAARIHVMVEQKVNITTLTGEANGFGTSDFILLVDNGDGTGIVIVIDFKFGRGVVVAAEENEQCLAYAWGSRVKARELWPEVTFKDIHIYISQPRVSVKPSIWSCTSDWMDNWAATVVRPKLMDARIVAEKKRHGEDITQYLTSSEDSCRFCKAASFCPALKSKAKLAADAVEAMFDDETVTRESSDKVIEKALAAKLRQEENAAIAEGMALAPLLEIYSTAVRAELERRLIGGHKFKDWKLVLGRQGARKYADKDEAEAKLKSFRIGNENIYNYKLISPTQAEKLAEKKVIGPRQWTSLQPLITRSEPKKHVAPMSDEREAVPVVALADGDFDDVSEQQAPAPDHSDLA